MKTQLLKLAEIVTNAGTQIRARIDEDTVDQYAEAMRDASNKFPPVVVFHDGSQFILADGFHRVMAAGRNGFLDIESDVRKGTRADALKFALGANAAHGLKRTNADKRRCVELALDEWPKLSSREIAKVCAVSDPFVGEVRQLLTVSSYPEKPENSARIGADGKERKMPTRKPKVEAANPEPIEPAEQPEVNPSEIQTNLSSEPKKYSIQDEAWQNAIGCSDARNFFASQIEDICSGAITDGSMEQLTALKLELQVAVKKIEAELRTRRIDGRTE